MSSKTIDGYTYSLSTNKNKKLKVVVDNKTIHFGDSRYPEHFFDRTGLLPKSNNHGDEKRKASYLARASKIKDSTGLAKNNPKSANYHAIRILWDGN
jgi:hypothetical protein